MDFVSSSTNAATIDDRYEDLLKMHSKEQDPNSIFQSLGSSLTTAMLSYNLCTSSAIPPNERGRKKRISTNIILPPFLGALAMDLLHSHERIDPRALLTLVVSTIKAKFIDVDTPPSDDEKEAIFAKFDPLLIFQ